MSDRPALVSEQAWPHVQTAEQPDAAPPLWERNRAIKALDAELAAIPRLGAGLGCWLLGLAGVAGLATAAWHGGPVVLRVLALVVGLALLTAAYVAGRRVIGLGRRVVAAFCWWQLLSDGDASGVERAVDTRAWYLHPRRFLTAGLATVAFLAPLVFLDQATSRYSSSTWPEDQTLSLTVAVLGGIVVSWRTGAALFASMSRAGSAQGHKDPVTQRILGRRGR